ncbi:hypothetical protein KA005_62260 [bacterium]|nr:hypothetical protein [bacterium]
MKEYFRKILIFFLGFCLGMAVGGFVIYRNLYDSIPWEDEFKQNTLEWMVVASDIEYLSEKLSRSIEQFEIELERLIPALGEQ